jgi:hypothetical protein
VDSVPDQMSVVSSSSEKNKSNEDLSRQGYNDLEDVKAEDHMLHVTGDIRKIVHREKIELYFIKGELHNSSGLSHLDCVN